MCRKYVCILVATAAALGARPSDSSTLTMQWAGQRTNIQAVAAGSCTLSVSVSDGEVLPEEWHLIWVGTSEAAAPLTITGLAGVSDAADACAYRPASSQASVYARVDTVVHCSTSGSRAREARYLVSYEGDTRAKIALASPSGTASIVYSGEVTINGGLPDPYPPVAASVRGARSPGRVSIYVYGMGLESVQRAQLIPDSADRESVALGISEVSETLVSLQQSLAEPLPGGTLELDDANGRSAALTFEPEGAIASSSAASDHFLICFAPGAASIPTDGTSGTLQEFSFSPPSLGEALSTAGVTQLDRGFPWFRAEDVESTNILGEPVHLADLSTIYVAHIEPGTDVQGAMTALGGQEGIEYVEPAYFGGATSFPADPPNDPLYSGQWGLENIGQTVCERAALIGFDVKARDGWTRTLGTPDVPIAIIDTGIDNTHVELVSHTIMDTTFIPYGNPFPFDDNGHGTAVAGLVAATANNGEGIAGVAPLTTLHAIKVLDANEDGDVFQWAQAIDRSRDRGYPILNLSISTKPSGVAADSIRTIRRACLDAYLSGALVVASAGNLTTVNEAGIAERPRAMYPACFARRVCTVGAITALQPNGARRWSDLELFPGFCGGAFYYNCHGSNYWDPLWTSEVERFVDLVAPGGQFIVTTDRGPYWYKTLADCTQYSSPVTLDTGFSGTSASAPLVSGAAALLRARYGMPLSGDEIEHILKITARRPGLPLTETPPDRRYGWGLVDVDSAMKYIEPPRVLTRGVLAGSDLTVVASFGTNVGFLNIPGVVSSYCVRYILRGTLSFSFYTTTPDLWVRGSGSEGATDTTTYDAGVVVPSGRVLSVSPSAASLETSVFWIPNYGWVPTDPAHARIAWTAVGPANVVGVESGPRDAALSVRGVPNPVRGAARIELVLPGSGLTTVRILDLSGRVVADLAKGVLGPGEHAFQWNGRDGSRRACAAGVYFVRAEQGGVGITRKLILLQGGGR